MTNEYTTVLGRMLRCNGVGPEDLSPCGGCVISTMSAEPTYIEALSIYYVLSVDMYENTKSMELGL